MAISTSSSLDAATNARDSVWSDKQRLKTFARAFSIAALAILIGFAGAFVYLEKVETSGLAANVTAYTKHRAERFGDTVETFGIDVMSLAQIPALHRFIDNGTDSDRQEVEREFAARARIWSAFAQVRYLDAKGFERVRVDQDGFQS